MTRLLLPYALVVIAPALALVLAAPAQVSPTAPIGADGWAADPRHLPDPVSTPPAAVRDALAQVGAPEDLVHRYPGVVGNLDGAPFALRYEANARAMATAGEAHPGRYLLFDPRGNGHVAQVYGELDTADRVAVLVPGAGNRLYNFWHGVGGVAIRSPSRQAANLYTAAGAPAGLAVVAWLGYDPPRALDAGAAREDLARAGADALVRFVAGIIALRPHATVALIGHSYGSTVIGLAAPGLPGQVTDLAVVASPGMGVTRAGDLHTTARVWAGLADRDVVRLVPNVRLLGLGHGRAPTDPAFGARVFAARDVAGHDHYLDVGTDSLRTLAAIASAGGAS
ncbi:alpha/beta hydrolase [Dactylosporangium sp. NPDC000555]|uniref:alpha/beta hydrolase n=1 Tax=Dactylosporangium sp. NPDC000555 TaxID=3154260 RepID=UPI00332959CE